MEGSTAQPEFGGHSQPDLRELDKSWQPDTEIPKTGHEVRRVDDLKLAVDAYILENPETVIEVTETDFNRINARVAILTDSKQNKIITLVELYADKEPEIGGV